MPPSQQMSDSMIRHWVDLQRRAGAQSAETQRLLAEEDVKLVSLLRRQLAGATTPAKRAKLVAEIKALRKETFEKVHAKIKADLFGVAKNEAQTIGRIVSSSVGAPAQFEPVADKDLRRISSTSRTIGGVMRANDSRRIVQAVRSGLASGESTDAIVARVAGTPGARYADGVLATTRRDADAEVKTAVVKVANAAQTEWSKANRGVVEEERWEAILDGATCETCRSLNGVVTKKQPPAHHLCRCGKIPVIDLAAVAERVPDQLEDS